GMGVGFVPRRIAYDALLEKKFEEIQLKETIPSIDIGILINKSKPLSIAAQKYLDILNKTKL
ncbi:MAG TPA: LysR family transcriptional regulator, partial [Fusibacter sp.]|nr:LysR family transcriptional regulator [Fusibacter sp.]